MLERRHLPEGRRQSEVQVSSQCALNAVLHRTVSECLTIQSERAGACTDIVNSQTFPKRVPLSFNVKAPGFDLTEDHVRKVLPHNTLLRSTFFFFLIFFLLPGCLENLKCEPDLKNYIKVS